MNTTLLIIIGIIVVSWLIALCFKDFRDRCVNDLPDIFSEPYQMIVEEESDNIFGKIFLTLLIIFIVYPFLIALIIFSPILCGFIETGKIIGNWVGKYIKVERHIKKNKKKDYRSKIEIWRDSRIKGLK